MTKMLLKYVHEFKDRHSKTRRYFRRSGHKRTPLHGEPGSEEFRLAYERALKGETAPKLEIGVARTAPGTIDALVVRYYKSSAYLDLADLTRKTYRNALERFRVGHGAKRVKMMDRQAVKALLAKKAATPSAANELLKVLRRLMALAVDLEMRTDDPTLGVKFMRTRTDGHPAWSANDIAAFREAHALGTRARLAMEMAYNTMQRRSDLVRMGRQHVQMTVEGLTLSIRQKKTGTDVDIPVLADLRAVLDLLPAGQLTFLMTEYGKSFSAAGFGIWFRQCCDDAGLPPGYNTHGLRKAGATRLAEEGCTDHEIMAWGGWTSLSEVQRYTKKANRKKLARGVVTKLERGLPLGQKAVENQ